MESNEDSLIEEGSVAEEGSELEQSFVDRSSSAVAGELPSAQVPVSADIYDATLVACFGGVLIKVDREDKTFMHPFFLLALVCLPLIMVQFSLAFYVGLDLDLKRPIYDKESNHDDVVNTLKMVLIGIVQLMSFDRLLGCLRSLMFVINPTTWTDIVRAYDASFDDDQWGAWKKQAFRPAFIFPCALAAQLMKFSIMYFVVVSSVSIILNCDSVNSAIFDSLAITFILDLDAKVWELTATLLQLDRFETGDQFIMDPAYAKRSGSRWGKRFPWLHRGNGGRRVENGMALFVWSFLLMRQFLVVVYAMHTNILPVARDVCTIHRGFQGENRSAFGACTTWFVSHFLIADPTPGIFRVAKDICTSDHDRMRFGQMISMMGEYPQQSVVFVSFIMCAAILPHVFLSTSISTTISHMVTAIALKWGMISEEASQKHFVPSTFQALKGGVSQASLDSTHKMLMDKVAFLEERLSDLADHKVRLEEQVSHLSINKVAMLEEQLHHLRGSILPGGLGGIGGQSRHVSRPHLLPSNVPWSRGKAAGIWPLQP